MRSIVGDPQLGVAARDTRVVDDDVGRLVAPDDGQATEQWVAVTVDVDPRAVGAATGDRLATVGAARLSSDSFTPNSFTPHCFTPDCFSATSLSANCLTPDCLTPDCLTTHGAMRGQRGDGGINTLTPIPGVGALGRLGQPPLARCGPHPKDAGLEVGALEQGHLERAGGLVALRVGVLHGRGDELVGQVGLELLEAVVVGGGQLDRVDVRDHRATGAEQGSTPVHRAADGARDLDRLDLGLERFGEGTVHCLRQAVLDPVHDSHDWLLSLFRGRFIVTVPATATAPVALHGTLRFVSGQDRSRQDSTDAQGGTVPSDPWATSWDSWGTNQGDSDQNGADQSSADSNGAESNGASQNGVGAVSAGDDDPWTSSYSFDLSEDSRGSNHPDGSLEQTSAYDLRDWDFDAAVTTNSIPVIAPDQPDPGWRPQGWTDEQENASGRPSASPGEGRFTDGGYSGYGTDAGAGLDAATGAPLAAGATGDPLGADEDDRHGPRAAELVSARARGERERHKASGGWRRALGLGPGARERLEMQRIDRIERPLDGRKTVMVINTKGGGGKTLVSIMLATYLGRYRTGQVLAWDNNETEGTLGMRAPSTPHHRTVVDLLGGLPALAANPTAGPSELGHYVREQKGLSFDVLASADDDEAMRIVGEHEFEELHSQLSRFYRMIIIDTGNNRLAPNWLAAVRQADMLVFATSLKDDTSVVAAKNLDALVAAGREDLVRNAVCVISHTSAKADPGAGVHTREHFDRWVRSVVDIPYDPALAPGLNLDPTKIAPRTHEACLEMTACVVDGL